MVETNKEDIKNAIVTINDAIIKLNNGRTDSEDFYWWNSVLEIFGLCVKDGEIVLEDYPKGSYADKNRFFKKWDQDDDLSEEQHD